MNILLLLAALHCPITKIEQPKGVPWTDYDTKHLVRANSQCKVYYPKSPCLKKFIKIRRGQYRAICGR